MSKRVELSEAQDIRRWQMWCEFSHGHRPLRHPEGTFVEYADHVTALAAERERALRWAVIEVRGALANQHREGYGPYLPAVEQFVQDGLRALTPAPGAADTTTEGNHA